MSSGTRNQSIDEPFSVGRPAKDYEGTGDLKPLQDEDKLGIPKHKTGGDMTPVTRTDPAPSTGHNIPNAAVTTHPTIGRSVHVIIHRQVHTTGSLDRFQNRLARTGSQPL
nr:unnamed protein product [Spirometra erinaceieuropaei]